MKNPLHFAGIRQSAPAVKKKKRTVVKPGLVEEGLTAHTLLNVLNEKHGAKGSGACAYVFIFCNMFRLPGNHAALFRGYMYIFGVFHTFDDHTGQERVKKSRGSRPVRYKVKCFTTSPVSQ